MADLFLGFPPLLRALEQLNRLDEHQFQALRGAVIGSAGFARSLPRCTKLANQLGAGLDAGEVFRLLSSLEFLYDRAREWEAARRDVRAALDEFFEFSTQRKSLGEDQRRLGYERLTELIVKNPAVERRRKIQRLRTGILDTAIDFSSFVDLRPRITDDRTGVEELIPVVIFRVVTDSEYEKRQPHVFQLTIEGVAKLRTGLHPLTETGS